MTPRSRKPVMLLGLTMCGSETSQQNYSFSSLPETSEEEIYQETDGVGCDDEEQSDQQKPLLIEEGGTGNSSNSAPESLTSVFKDYLFSRSVLTATPTDLSFSSQPDDFCSNTDIRNLSETEMSESLLYCLDGNRPEDLSFVSQDSDHDFMDSGSNNVRKRCHSLIDGGGGEQSMRHGDVDKDLQIKKVILETSSSELGETSL